MVAITAVMAVSTLARGQTGVRKHALRRASRVVRVQEPVRDCVGRGRSRRRCGGCAQAKPMGPGAIQRERCELAPLTRGVPRRACALWIATLSLIWPSCAFGDAELALGPTSGSRKEIRKAPR